MVPFTGPNCDLKKNHAFRIILEISNGSLWLMDLERNYLLITPRPSPLHLTPWVPHANQLNRLALEINLGESNSRQCNLHAVEKKQHNVDSLDNHIPPLHQ